jgi:hypothetical protein
MRNVRNGFVKNLNYLCLVGVIALGLITIVATGGGDGGGAKPDPVFIDFDDVTAPDLFIDTIALTDTYSSLGVNFSGPSANSGGGIVTDISWPITGNSDPNILGFNNGASYSDAGSPTGPETITFSTPASSVSILAGLSEAGTITMTAYDSSDSVLDIDSIAADDSMALLSVSAADIDHVIISYSGGVCVLDDLYIIY